MAKEKTIGMCALCKKKKVELMKSHIIPKAIYERTRTYKDSRFRNFYNLKDVHQNGEHKPLLCHDCEEFFSWYETKFIKLFLDKYLSSPDSPLPIITKDAEFYILTVAWRILYDGLYNLNSYMGNDERKYFGEYERKLSKYLFARYLEKNPNENDSRIEAYESDIDGEYFFEEMIPEMEMWEKSIPPEDMSEIKSYIYKIGDLEFTDEVNSLFHSIIFGDIFCDSTKTKYYIISGYNGLIITTVYQRKRNVWFRCNRKLFRKALKTDEVVKKDIIEHLVRRLIEIKNDYPKVQKKLDEDGLRDKIQKRYEGKQKLK